MSKLDIIPAGMAYLTHLAQALCASVHSVPEERVVLLLVKSNLKPDIRICLLENRRALDWQ